MEQQTTDTVNEDPVAEMENKDPPTMIMAANNDLANVDDGDTTSTCHLTETKEDTAEEILIEVDATEAPIFNDVPSNSLVAKFDKKLSELEEELRRNRFLEMQPASANGGNEVETNGQKRNDLANPELIADIPMPPARDIPQSTENKKSPKSDSDSFDEFLKRDDKSDGLNQAEKIAEVQREIEKALSLEYNILPEPSAMESVDDAKRTAKSNSFDEFLDNDSQIANVIFAQEFPKPENVLADEDIEFINDIQEKLMESSAIKEKEVTNEGTNKLTIDKVITAMEEMKSTIPAESEAEAMDDNCPVANEEGPNEAAENDVEDDSDMEASSPSDPKPDEKNGCINGCRVAAKATIVKICSSIKSVKPGETQSKPINNNDPKVSTDDDLNGPAAQTTDDQTIAAIDGIVSDETKTLPVLSTDDDVNDRAAKDATTAKTSTTNMDKNCPKESEISIDETANTGMDGRIPAETKNLDNDFPAFSTDGGIHQRAAKDSSTIEISHPTKTATTNMDNICPKEQEISNDETAKLTLDKVMEATPAVTKIMDNDFPAVCTYSCINELSTNMTLDKDFSNMEISPPSKTATTNMDNICPKEKEISKDDTAKLTVDKVIIAVEAIPAETKEVLNRNIPVASTDGSINELATMQPKGKGFPKMENTETTNMDNNCPVEKEISKDETAKLTVDKVITVVEGIPTETKEVLNSNFPVASTDGSINEGVTIETMDKVLTSMETEHTESVPQINDKNCTDVISDGCNNEGAAKLNIAKGFSTMEVSTPADTDNEEVEKSPTEPSGINDETDVALRDRIQGKWIVSLCHKNVNDEFVKIDEQKKEKNNDIKKEIKGKRVDSIKLKKKGESSQKRKVVSMGEQTLSVTPVKRPRRSYNRPESSDCESTPKMHICDFMECKMSFRREASLWSHKKSHGNKPLICCYCQRQYVHSARLKSHLAAFHGNMSD